MERNKLIFLLINFTLAGILFNNTYNLGEIQPTTAFDSIHSYEITHDSSFLVDLDKLFMYSLLFLIVATLLTKLVLAIHEYPDWYFNRNRVLFTPVYFGADYVRIPLSLFSLKNYM